MLLYDYFRSSAAYRVRIALHLKGVAFDRHALPLLEDAHLSPEHRARNPQGLVPALVLDDGTVLTQSLAIIDWLDTAYPTPRLIPTDPVARAHALAQALVIGADVHPINNLRITRYLKHVLNADDAARAAWSQHWIAEGLAALEAMAGSGPFLGGTAPGIADLFLVPQLYNARRVEAPLDAYPKLLAAEAAMLALDSVAAAHPDRFSPA
ncbi:maleylacetoacetate isomerase [Sphingomonas sp. CJ20]